MAPALHTSDARGERCGSVLDLSVVESSCGCVTAYEADWGLSDKSVADLLAGLRIPPGCEVRRGLVAEVSLLPLSFEARRRWEVVGGGVKVCSTSWGYEVGGRTSGPAIVMLWLDLGLGCV